MTSDTTPGFSYLCRAFRDVRREYTLKSARYVIPSLDKTARLTAKPGLHVVLGLARRNVC